MSLVLDLIFPKNCLVCHKSGHYLCPNCLSQQIRKSIQPPPKKSGCEGCLSLFKYNSLIKQSIAQLKYNFVTDISPELVSIMAKEIKSNFPHLLAYWQSHNFVLVPIPLYHLRQNWRGFNQSVLLGQSLAQKLKLKFSDQILTRIKNTHSQAKLVDKLTRKSNLKDAFVCSTKNTPSNIILFDDVTTTNSTFNSAYKSLSCVAQIHCWYLSLAG